MISEKDVKAGKCAVKRERERGDRADTLCMETLRTFILACRLAIIN